MMIFTALRDFFASLEERVFYYYLIGFLVIMILISGGMLYYIYANTASYLSDIETINEERATKIKRLLNKGMRIKAMQKEINHMLSEDKNFKISGEFNKLSESLGITPAKTQTSQTDLDDKYQESILIIDFTGITMRQLLTLLQAIEKIERIYAKQLDIARSTKIENGLDVKLIIATLLPKTIEAD